MGSEVAAASPAAYALRGTTYFLVVVFLNLTAHTQAGGMCPTATCSTKQLMKDGAPLRATARLKRAKCGKKTRPDMLYANEQREKFKAEWVAAGNTGKFPAGLMAERMKEFFR